MADEKKIVALRGNGNTGSVPLVAAMKNKSMPIFLCFLLSVFFIGVTGMSQTGCAELGSQSSQPTEKIGVQLHGFSPDNRFLSFDLFRGMSCFASLMDLHSGEVTKIIPPDPDEWWTSGTFSPSGKYLAFTVKRKSEKLHWSQLGIYDISKGTLKSLTHTQSFKAFPSFSPDEKRLIYSKPERERESGKTRYGGWDIYELDIASGQERQLTNYKFYMIGRPFYMPDGKRFIFSGWGRSNYEGTDNKSNPELLKAYQKKHKDNTIFILGEENAELHPAFTNGPSTNGPKISRDGKSISYHARSDEMDRAAGEKIGGYTYDIFMLENGKHRRLTKLKKSLDDYTMSPDGSLIAYTSKPEKDGEIELWLLDVEKDETKRVEIALKEFFTN
ncbi:MAG: hypothetical protein V2B20_27095 [Pseudomonadota bacterium]